MNSGSFKPALTPDFIARALHIKVTVLHKPNSPFSKVTTDSRQVIHGALFVALKGEKHDGHDHIDQAIAQGARGVLCRRGVPISNYKEICVFAVEDSLLAYRRLAAAWRKEFSIPIVVVAGSAGKTTTKEFLAAILRGKWTEVLKTQGSQNGLIGIPMTLIELRPEHEAAVVEVGIDEIGAMQSHMQLIGANASLLTSIGPEHLVHLRDIPTVAREEGIALSHVSKTGGMIAINLDDPWIRPHANTIREGRKIPFSLQGVNTSLDMISGKLSEDGRDLIFQGLGIPPTSIGLPLLGDHNATNLLGAIAIAVGLGLSPEEIQAGLRYFKGMEGRSEVVHFPNGTAVICDYYNAQPASVLAGFELLAQIALNRHQKDRSSTPKKRGSPQAEEQQEGKRWACLGDMLELGPEQERFHRELASKILELEIENVLLYGPLMATLLEELEQRGYGGNRVHFSSQEELASNLIQNLKQGDTVLIKGSRGMKMEEVWKRLEPHLKSTGSVSTDSQDSFTHA